MKTAFFTLLVLTIVFGQNVTLAPSICDTPNYNDTSGQDGTFTDSNGVTYNANNYSVCSGHGICVNNTCFCSYRYAGDSCAYARKNGWRAFGYSWLCLLPGGCGVDRFYLGYTALAIGKTILGLAVYICSVAVCCVFCFLGGTGKRGFLSVVGCIAILASLAIFGWWLRDLIYEGKQWLVDSNDVMPYY